MSARRLPPRLAALCPALFVVLLASRASAQEAPTIEVRPDDDVRVTEVGIRHHVGPTRGGHFEVDATCRGEFPCRLPVPSPSREVFVVGEDGDSEFSFEGGRRPVGVQIHRVRGLAWFGPLLISSLAIGATGGALLALDGAQRLSPQQVAGIAVVVAGALTAVSSVVVYSVAREHRVTLEYASVMPMSGGAIASVALRF